METRNEIIASLAPADRRTWEPYFVRETLEARQELAGPDDPIDCLWFIESGVCSQVIESSDARSVEVAVIGREGFVGLPGIFGVRYPASRTIVQVGGSALRIGLDEFVAHLHGDHPLLRHLEHYAAITLCLLSQIAGCNRLHRADQRLARWLLMVCERLDTAMFPVTHDFLALMLGASRPSVSDVAQELQTTGAIRYERGFVQVVDADALRASACECYGVIQRLMAFNARRQRDLQDRSALWSAGRDQGSIA